MENKNVNETKDKMIKSCRLTRRIITVFEWIVILSVVMVLMWMVTTLISPLFTQELEENQVDSVLDESFNNLQERTYKWQEKLDEIQQKKEDNDFLTVMNIIIVFGILSNLIKILKNTEEHGTPFIEENIKSLKKIVIGAFISWILTTVSILNVGLMYVLILWTLYNVFKYAYQLQTESDETL